MINIAKIDEHFPGPTRSRAADAVYLLLPGLSQKKKNKKPLLNKLYVFQGAHTLQPAHSGFRAVQGL